MNFLLVTPIGDIEPYLALGAALRAAGHGATLLAQARHQSAAAQAQLTFFPLAGEDRGNEAEDLGPSDELDELKNLYERLAPRLGELLDATLGRLPEHDMLVYSHLFPFLKCAASKAGRKSVALVHSPENIPSADYGPGGSAPAAAWVPKFFRQRRNHRAWAAKEKLLDDVVNRALGAAMNARGLAAFSGFLFEPADLALVAVSPALLPPRGAWPSRFVSAGFLRWDAPVNELTAGLSRVVTLERTGQPVAVLAYPLTEKDFPGLVANWPPGAPLVILTQNAALAENPQRPEILLVHDVPRELLFSLATVVIHDGGAGATAAALHMGRPQIVIPHRASQNYWAHVVEQLGVAKILPSADWPKLLPAALADVLRDVTMPRRAVERATLIRSENGATRAVEELEKL